MPTRIISTQRQLPCVPDVRRLKWPCPNGFHIPRIIEDLNQLMDNIMNGFTNKVTPMSKWKEVLLIPYSWHEWHQWFSQVWTTWYRWSATPRTDDPWRSNCVSFNDNSRSHSRPWRTAAMPIRPFKDEPVEPDNTWQVLHDWGNGGIYRNPTLWLITAKVTNKYWSYLIITLADKNLWATTAWTDASQSLTTDVTWYSWKKPYSSDKFIANGSWMYDWSSPSNDDLWWALSWNCKW